MFSKRRFFFAHRMAIGAATVALSCIAVTQLGVARADEATQYSPDQIKSIRAWAHSLAVQAGTFCASPVGMYNLRQGIATGAKPKAKPNHIWRMANISTPQLAKESGYVTPNVNTIYGFGFMDLGQEPIILTTPDSHGRYYIRPACIDV